MIDLNEKIVVEINVTTLGTLIAGLYTAFTEVSLFAIPNEMFIEIAYELLPFLRKWNYNNISFESFIKNSLLIYPIQMFSQIEYDEAKKNNIFIERRYGNATLIATANIEGF